jgi:signal transduction histidine kinase
VHEINFNNLLDEIFEELNYMENSEQIRKEVKVNASAVFYNDDKRIAIVLKNLLSNAIKYSITTYREASIKIFININAIECKIIIVDNGIGIAQEHQEKIFDMFYRGTELSNGTGIGLHIVKEIMTKLNGKISFESTFGEGSTFHLSIPNLQLDN